MNQTKVWNWIKQGYLDKSSSSEITQTEDTVKPLKNKVYFISQFI